jgi:DNA-directed RNA polymerase specialized sigma24 family protein
MSNDPQRTESADHAPEGSVARAIARYRNGDADALGELLKAYFSRLLTKARVRLRGNLQNDHEELVQSTFGSFLRGAMKGQYPAMKNRDELAKLLGTILHRKAIRRYAGSAKSNAFGALVFNEADQDFDPEGNDPDPSDEVTCREWLEHMDKLGLVKEARLIWEGYHFHEIAERLGITESKARRSITLVHKQTEIFFGIGKKSDRHGVWGVPCDLVITRPHRL